MEIGWRHLTIILISAMNKFEPNQILWVQHPNFKEKWPAKVIRRVSKDHVEVQFFNVNALAQLREIVDERTCKRFSEVQIDPKESPLQLYDAFKLALKESKRPKKEEEECTHEQVGKEWGIAELKNCIDSLILGVPSGSALERVKSGLCDFCVRKEESRAYLCEMFTQKLSYLLSQPLEKELRGLLEKMQKALLELLVSQFLIGAL